MTDERTGSTADSQTSNPERPLPSYSGDAPFVFVCYAHRDDVTVHEELRWLQNAGVNLWYDEGIGGGAIWRSEIASAIEKAKLVLFFASPSSVRSDHCNRELNYALECGRPILPVYLEPADLTADLRLGLSRVQAIHRYSFSEAVYRRKLLDAIEGSKRLPAPVSGGIRSSWSSRFAVAVLTIIAAAGGWLAVNIQTETPSLKALAVLPFVNLSDDPDQEYFAAGMHDAVIGELSRIGALRIIARTSTLRYRDSKKTVSQIARELNVDGVINASVLKANGSVRIQVQLIEAFPDERQVWTQGYDREIGNVLAMHAEVAHAIAQAVQLQLTPQQRQRVRSHRAVNPATYEAYLRGTYHIRKFTPEGFTKGLAYLNEAIEKDPADPLAYAGLALAYGDLGHQPSSPPESFAKARAAARKAIALDETLAEAHLALGETQLYYEWKPDAAARSLRRALELNPNLASAHAHWGWYLDYAGRYEEAESALKSSVDLDPLDPLYQAWLGWWCLWTLRDLDAAETEVMRALDINPDHPVALFVLGLIYSEMGKHEEAIAAHERVRSILPLFGWGVGAAYASAGQSDEAQAVLSMMRDDNAEHAWGRAVIQARLGEKAAAVRSLEAAYKYRHQFMLWADRTPDFEPLRDHPAFIDLVRRTNSFVGSGPPESAQTTQPAADIRCGVRSQPLHAMGRLGIMAPC